MKRSATAARRGGQKDGKGPLATDRGVLDATPYSFGTRFENGKGTNPEELIAAAHAGCFSMALAMVLGEAGIRPERIDTRATVSLDRSDDGFAITAVHLDVKIRAPGASQAAFDEAAGKAKSGCPVSRLLRAEITMKATLSG
jgi:osmotically inducible protein OsmC